MIRTICGHLPEDFGRNREGVFWHHLTNANKGVRPGNDEAWDFLRHFHLLGYDLDSRAGVCLSLLHSHLGTASGVDADVLWLKIVGEVQARNPRAGVITLDDIPTEIRGLFRITLAPEVENEQPNPETPPFAAAQPVHPIPRLPATIFGTVVTMALVGSWDENATGDRHAIEQLSGVPFASWQDAVRNAYISNPGTLKQQSGVWGVLDREALWTSEGPRISDVQLDVFLDVAIAALREVDSGVAEAGAELEEAPQGCSRTLRRGVAEALALLGSRKDALTTCSVGKRETTAMLAVRKILAEADADLWASLNDVFPLLAEASPEEFLIAVEKAVGPLTNLFKKEGGGVFGRTYMSGLLWGLEALAWDEKYLVAVCRVLGELAAVDPGGRWTNRPSNSLTTILLPWFPQTCAPAQKCHAGVDVVVKEQPQVGWQLILSLLPQPHAATSSTYKPVWRRFISKDWKDGVPHAQYFKDVVEYFDKALGLAGNDTDRLIKLIERYFHVPLESRASLRDRLTSAGISELGEPERFRLWTAVGVLTTTHRKFAAHENWKVPEGSLEELDVIADNLRPTSPEIRHQRLFVSDEFNLYDDENIEAASQRLVVRRQDAAREVLAARGFQGLVEFARHVEAPWELGVTLGSVPDINHDSDVLPSLLESEEKQVCQFAQGYARSRFGKNTWAWTDSLPVSGWSHKAKGLFFSLLPFRDETWARVETQLAAAEGEYWTRTPAFPCEGATRIEMALAKLIDHGRPDRAIWYLRLCDKGLNRCSPALALRALNALKLTGEHQVDDYSVGELITRLQVIGSVDENELRKVELKFIQILGEFHHGNPVALSRGLAEAPDLFCEMLQAIYRPKNAEAPVGISEELKEKARSAYRVLREWRTAPGTRRDGSFDAAALASWIQAVKTRCLASGHWEIAGIEIGKILFYAPRDEVGLWSNAVCEVLDAKDHDNLRDGLTTEIFNSRGVVTFSGGAGEMKLSEDWGRRASIAEDRSFSRLAQALKRFADSYRHDAERQAKGLI